jgi:hypothetical protein
MPGATTGAAGQGAAPPLDPDEETGVMGTRILGAMLTILSAVAIFVLRAMLAAPPVDHHPTTAELLVAMLILVAGLPGVGMMAEGPSFFGHPSRRL